MLLSFVFFFPEQRVHGTILFPSEVKQIRALIPALCKMIRCAVLSACSAVGIQNQKKKKTFLICACCSQPFTAGAPLKKTDLYEVFVSIIGLPLCFVPQQQFDPNVLPQLLNGGKASFRL